MRINRGFSTVVGAAPAVEKPFNGESDLLGPVLADGRNIGVE
jgi:hypothetical protein